MNTNSDHHVLCSASIPYTYNTTGYKSFGVEQLLSAFNETLATNNLSSFWIYFYLGIRWS